MDDLPPLEDEGSENGVTRIEDTDAGPETVRTYRITWI